ncbi:hypothetical protein ACFFOS_27510 [Nocardioides kongjuensis]|uniref:Molecular chaperone DnaJ n=1 Tax=Nocardioides kongjuensis TaxID=349522 RepID=A0A852RK51_9ACTN|nr:molecular chaperone DnaJ [Nocardioides kongjuensis]NYD33871.1 hypothetical protein [Nocardioides kongjuensis]
MTYTVRPLSDRTWLRPEGRRTPTRFSSSWPETEELLLAEVGRLRGRDIVVEVDLREGDLRVDGRPKAKAQAATPAVVVAFETVAHGPMLYRCDTFTTSYYDQGPAWQHNVRAIAKTLEALRAVDRYGATETGQQYQGFRAIGGGTPMPAAPPAMPRHEAENVLIHWSGGPGPIDERAYRRARGAAHPDRHGGDRTAWDQVERAAQALGLAR